MPDGVQQRPGVFFESEQPCVEDSAVYPKAGQGALLLNPALDAAMRGESEPPSAAVSLKVQ